MCGLVGFASISAFYAPDMSKVLYQLLHADTLRGKDSTGIATVSGTKVEIFKKAMAAPEFLNTKEGQEALKAAYSADIAIGHNRAATMGAVIDSAAHPFQHDHITLVHNGTLEFDTNLEGNFETDSEEIAYTMSRFGEKETLERINGAFALVWWNGEDYSLNFARNNDRPFSYCVSKDESYLFWASESAMLSWILKRNRITHQSIMIPNPGQHFKVDMSDGKVDMSQRITSTPFREYIAPKKAYSYPQTGYGWDVGNTKKEIYTPGNATQILERDGYRSGSNILFTIKPESLRRSTTTVSKEGHNLYNVYGFTEIETHCEGYKINPVVSCLAYREDYIQELLGEDNPIKYGQDGTIDFEPVVVCAQMNHCSRMYHGQPFNGSGKNIEIFIEYGTPWHVCKLEDLEKEEYHWVKGLSGDYIGDKQKEDDLFDDEDIPFDQNSVIEGNTFVLGPNGSVIEESVMKELLKDGCSICHMELTPRDYDECNFEWSLSGEPICASCDDVFMKTTVTGV